MKKAFISSLIMSFTCITCFAQHPRITQLIAEKQAKMEKLEKCQGTTKNLKIAGISTLGITAVGVGANIAEAVVLNNAKEDVAKAKKARDAQQTIKDEREAAEKKRQEEEERKRQEQQVVTNDGSYLESAALGWITNYAKEHHLDLDIANCSKTSQNVITCNNYVFQFKEILSREEYCKTDPNNAICTQKNSGDAGGDEADEEKAKEAAAPVEQADAFSTACKNAGYKPDDQKNGSGDVTEHSCFAYLSEAATQDIADAKFKLIKESCPGSTIQWADDTYAYFVANCGSDAGGIPNRFYVKQRGGTANNALKQLEKACRDAGYTPVRADTDQNYVVCTIGGDEDKNAEPSVMEAALSDAATQLKDAGCGGEISRCKFDSCWYVACKVGGELIGDIRYEYKNLSCKDNEEEKGGECKPLNCKAEEHKFAKNHKCEECKTTEKLNKDGECVPVVCNGTLADTYLEKRQHSCYLKADVFSIDFSLKRAKSKDDAKQQIDNWMKTNIGFSIDSFKCTVIEAHPVFGNDVVECKNANTIFQFSFQNISDVDPGNTL